jgi:hypothetical protein
MIEESVSWLRNYICELRFDPDPSKGKVWLLDPEGKKRYLGHSALSITISILNAICSSIQVPYSFNEDMFWPIYNCVQPMIRNYTSRETAQVYDLNHNLLMDFGYPAKSRLFSLQQFIEPRGDWVNRYLKKKEIDAGRITLYEKELTRHLLNDVFVSLSAASGLDKILKDYGCEARLLPPNLTLRNHVELFKKFSFEYLVDAAKHVEKTILNESGKDDQLWSAYSFEIGSGGVCEIPF